MDMDGNPPGAVVAPELTPLPPLPVVSSQSPLSLNGRKRGIPAGMACMVGPRGPLSSFFSRFWQSPKAGGALAPTLSGSGTNLFLKRKECAAATYHEWKDRRGLLVYRGRRGRGDHVAAAEGFSDTMWMMTGCGVAECFG